MTLDANEAISVVVVAFHRPASLAQLLRRLSRPNIELLVVNVESDAEVQRVVDDAGVRIIDFDENVGYGAAVNAGVRQATAPHVVFLNDDVDIGAADVELLAQVVRSTSADVAVPMVRDGRGEREPTIAALPTPGRLLLEWALVPDRPIGWLRGLVCPQKWRSPDRPEQVDAAAAVVVATSAKLLADVPLPEDYFLYWEESEWFFRLHQQHRIVEYRPDAVAIHAGGRYDIRPEKSALLARNAVRCVRRTQGRISASAALFIVVVWQLRLVSVALVRRRLLKERLAGLTAALAAWRELR